ncbi:MAG: hypothetical protein HY832_03050 [Candidatus Aenigmarchaeota archaeon]|nr:hypothetical protein [Candidatus Aenigmarchaeota archaeon]
MNEQDMITFVKPLYKDKDSMHNFIHVLRIKRHVQLYRMDYPVLNQEKLLFLIYFHGLQAYVKAHESQTRNIGFPEEYFVALYRHTRKPKTIEEQLVSDANAYEAVGKHGIRRALRIGKERQQSMETTLALMQQKVNKIWFYTIRGKKFGNPALKIMIDYLKSVTSCVVKNTKKD